MGNINQTKQNIIRRIRELDRLDDEINLEDDRKIERQKFFTELKEINYKQKQWKQMARAKWIQHGDSISRCFHLIIKRIKMRLKWWKFKVSGVKNQVLLRIR